MTINTDKYLIAHKGIPHFTEDVVSSISHHGEPEDIYNIKWGDSQKAVRHGIIESGFLWDGLHFDTLGLYQSSSLNTKEATKLINDFNPEISAQEISQLGPQSSKFLQTDNDIQWDGVVLALQNPIDRSILTGAHERDYMAFVHRVCNHYKDRLFLKLHPWLRNEKEQMFREIADRYGCSIDHTNHTVLGSCEYCLVYNSTFAFDCFLRGVPVVQYAPGYFWQTGAVCYTGRTFSPDIESFSTIIKQGEKLANFCVWNYMIHCKQSSEQWINALKYFYDHKDTLFPILDNKDMSYAAEMIRRFS